MKVSALVVVYNQNITDIACLDALLFSECVSQIVVCDNSTEPNDNESESAALGVCYIPMNGNAGLSRAYNRGVPECTGDIVCVFDDDTTIIPGYFEALEGVYLTNAEWDIALPMVTANGRIISPVVFNGPRPRALSLGKGSEPRSRLSGINSGMAVKRHVYDQVRYDERLFLDHVDHRFCMDAQANGLMLVVVESMRLEQSFSLAVDEAKQALARYKIFEKDVRIFYEGSLLKRIYCDIMLLCRRIKMVARYKDSVFLFARL